MIWPDLQFIENQVPAILISLLALVTLVLCIYSIIKTRDLPAVGYILPVIYVLIIFTWFSINPPTLIERQFFSRVSYILFLINISTWRVVEILSNKKRNGSGIKPITWTEVKGNIKAYKDKILKRG